MKEEYEPVINHYYYYFEVKDATTGVLSNMKIIHECSMIPSKQKHGNPSNFPLKNLDQIFQKCGSLQKSSDL